MAVQDYKINYKSDFVLNINGDAGWATQFCIKFWTGMPSQAYFVGFDGVKYVNCRVGDTPTQLLVMFDDHHLPIGKLMMQIAYHTTIEEFPGSVFDEVTNARDVIVTIDGTDYQVMLDFTGEDAPELEFDLPAYANEAERIQNELQRQQNEAARIEAELEREQATAAAVQGAENVNAQLNGTTLTVTNRQGVSTSVNTKGEQGEQGPVGPEGPQGETGISIVDFSPKSQTATTLIYTATFSDGHTQDVAIPKGPKGDTGATGPVGPQGPQGDTGVSITGMVKTGETSTDTLYNITFSNGTTQAVAIPKGEKGDQGPIGPQGPQGPMGDVAVITPEQQAAFTMYSTTGQNTNGPMTQKAVTDALDSILSTGIEGLYDTIGEAYPQQTTWNKGVINTTTGAIVSSNYRCYSNAIEGRMVTMTCKVISDNYYIHSVIEYSSSEIGTDSFVKLDIYDSTKTLREYSVTTSNYVVFVVSNVTNNTAISPAQANSYAVIKNQYEPVASLFDKTDGLIEDRTTKGKEIFYSPISSDSYGYIDYLGELQEKTSSNPFRYTELLNVFSGDIIYITSIIPSSAAVLAAYDKDGLFLSSIRGEETDEEKEYKFIVTDNVKYVRLTINTTGEYSCTIDRNYNALLNNSNYIEETFTPISQAWGYVGTDGVIVTRTDNTWVYTYPIKVSQGDILSFVGTSASGSSIFAGYSSDDITTAIDVKIGSSDRYSKLWQYYVVPEGVDYVRITHKYAIDGNITVTHFQRTVDVARKSVSVLFIGNSLTQDSVTYLPLLMREIAPEVDFKFYIWYNPGFDLAQQYDYFVNNTPCSIFSVCENSSSWANYKNSKNMQTILQNYEFDIVSLQEYFYRKTSYTESDLSDFNNCVNYIQEHYSKPFKVATLFHAPIRDVAQSCFELTKEGCELILSKTVAENLIPTGVAVYRALSTDLDNLGSQGHLSPDGIHTQEGLPCMMQAYVTAMWLFKQLGLPYSIVNSKSVVEADNFFQMNIPGPNPPDPTASDIVVGTSSQVKLSQKVAVLAFKEGEGIENDSFGLIDNQ